MTTLKLSVKVPDGCSYTTEQDALFYAVTHNQYTRSSNKKWDMSKTNLKNKCGSCESFCPIYNKYGEMTCYGNCKKGYVVRPRTTRICKEYERAKQ